MDENEGNVPKKEDVATADQNPKPVKAATEEKLQPKAEAATEEKPQPKAGTGSERTPQTKSESAIKMFGRWDVAEVEVADQGLKNYINIRPVMVPRTGGRWATKPFHKNDMSIVERFMNKLMVPGHRGKRHKLTSGRCTASTNAIYLQVRDAFDIIEKKTKKNPVQVLVQAVENASLLEEIAAYRLGGIIARQAVIVAPQRRLDIALKHLAQGIYKTSFKNRKSLAMVIAEELIAAAENDPKSFAVSERNRIEREAEGAR
jgi:small subunit ribosomal protein S7